jgi:hypothetical protein
LLTRPGGASDLDAALAVHAVFDGVPTADITPFVVIRAVTPEGRLDGPVVRVVLVGDPAGRLDEVRGSMPAGAGVEHLLDDGVGAGRGTARRRTSGPSPGVQDSVGKPCARRAGHPQLVPPVTSGYRDRSRM